MKKPFCNLKSVFTLSVLTTPDKKRVEKSMQCQKKNKDGTCSDFQTKVLCGITNKEECYAHKITLDYYTFKEE